MSISKVGYLVSQINCWTKIPKSNHCGDDRSSENAGVGGEHVVM